MFNDDRIVSPYLAMTVQCGSGRRRKRQAAGDIVIVGQLKLFAISKKKESVHVLVAAPFFTTLFYCYFCIVLLLQTFEAILL